jgi:hypothetical protein
MLLHQLFSYPKLKQKMEFHLAQINIGKILAPIDSPVMAKFVANLDRINALAENSEGFCRPLLLLPTRSANLLSK